MTPVDPSHSALEARFPATTVRLADGASVVVRRCGNAGPAFVLLHGISSGAASWLDCATALGAHGRVIAWDAPGYGDSTPFVMPAPQDVDYSARLGQLLSALEIDHCILVGHSLGALMAAAFASGDGRGQVSRLVLISPAGGYGAAERSAQRINVHDKRLDDLKQLGIEGIADGLPSRLLSAGATELQRDQVRRNALRLNEGGYAQAVEMLCNADLGRHARLSKPPTRVLCGDADRVTSPESCRQWATKWAVPFVSIPNAGHASPIEQPETVARLIAAVE